MVQLLLHSGADEAATDSDGNTPTEVVGTCTANTDDVRNHFTRNGTRKRPKMAPMDRSWRRRAWLVLCRARWFARVAEREKPPSDPLGVSSIAPRAPRSVEENYSVLPCSSNPSICLPARKSSPAKQSSGKASAGGNSSTSVEAWGVLRVERRWYWGGGRTCGVGWESVLCGSGGEASAGWCKMTRFSGRCIFFQGQAEFPAFLPLGRCMYVF